MISRRHEALYGFVFAVESLKSVILTLAVMEGRLGVEEAVRLSRLEVDYQVGRNTSEFVCYDILFFALFLWSPSSYLLLS